MLKISKKISIFFIIFFLFGVICLIFWKQFLSTHKHDFTSKNYETIIKNINIKKPESLNQAEKFIIENKNIYGTLTALYLAKQYILSNDLDTAFLQLNNSLKYTKEENLKNILNIRMAKIRIQQNKNEQAMSILKNVLNNHWSNIIHNMQGDIFINKKDKKEALKQWKKSLSIEDSNASKEIINMKMNELKE